MTLNFEAGYMHAVFPHTTTRRLLQLGPGPYMPPFLVGPLADQAIGNLQQWVRFLAMPSAWGLQ